MPNILAESYSLPCCRARAQEEILARQHTVEMVEDVVKEMGYDVTQAFRIHLDPRPLKPIHLWLIFSTCFWIVGSGKWPSTNVAEEWTSTYRARGALEFKDLNYYQAWLPMTNVHHHDSDHLCTVYVSFW